jgi:hypothetical protein
MFWDKKNKIMPLKIGFNKKKEKRTKIIPYKPYKQKLSP